MNRLQSDALRLTLYEQMQVVRHEAYAAPTANRVSRAARAICCKTRVTVAFEVKTTRRPSVQKRRQ